jgi:acyl-CoA thioester hydrolase
MIHTVSHIRVRYAETDRMDVVYHSNYFVWFETARILMLDQIGIPYLSMEQEGLLIPVLTASADYKIPARFDDRLDIHLFMRKKPRARFYFEYAVRRDDTLLATGTTSHGFMDKTGKGLRPPEHFLAKLEEAWKPKKNGTNRAIAALRAE